MTTMVSEVYEAFRSVGVPEDKTRAAAEALAKDQPATKTDIVKLEREMKTDIARLERETKTDIARLERELKGSIARWKKN